MSTAGGTPSESPDGPVVERISASEEIDALPPLRSPSVLLASDDMERAFRAATADSYARQIRFGLATLSLPLLAFASTDYTLFGDTWPFRLLLAMRIAIVTSAVLVARVVRTSPDARLRDRSLLAWWVALSLCVTAIDASRPPTYLLHIAIDVLFVLTAYVLPNRWSHQIGAGVASTLGPVVVFATCKGGLLPTQLALVAISFVYANTIGAILSRHLNAAARTEFVAHTRELEARAKLREISRLLPMCSSCKSIRDSSGQWHKVEEFVHAETGSDITHGLCPDCVRELYPAFKRRVPA